MWLALLTLSIATPNQTTDNQNLETQSDLKGYPGLAYLPPVEEIDNDITDEVNRYKRVLVFRPLFVYRQEQIKKMRLTTTTKPPRRQSKPSVTTPRPPTRTTPSYAYQYPNYVPTYERPSNSYTYYGSIPYYRPPSPSHYYDDFPNSILTYPKQPEYSAYYPTYVWSNYIENPNRRE